jgi:hypothetical protein
MPELGADMARALALLAKRDFLMRLQNDANEKPLK